MILINPFSTTFSLKYLEINKQQYTLADTNPYFLSFCFYYGQLFVDEELPICALLRGYRAENELKYYLLKK